MRGNQMEKKKNPFNFITSFSKSITVVWLLFWVETLLFAQFATFFNFGDALSIQYILQTVTEIGVIIAGFYFSSKTVENVAKGIQRHRMEMYDKMNPEEYTDNSDEEDIPVE